MSATAVRRSASAIRRRSHRPSSALVGGVNSPVRACRQVGVDPILLVSGRGARVVDAQGTPFLDFIMGWGALILGHAHPEVVRALRQALSRDILLGLTGPDEEALARMIVDAVPSVEQVRFTTSGTEACMTAVRLARACTGRSKILIFEGGYHGHSDSVMAGHTAGIPELLARETVSVPFNNPGAFEEALRLHGPQLACVIVEPVAANMGVVPPAPGWLARIRALTKAHGILLIFDEVVTGFRLAWGGAQEAFGIRPDLTTFGKIIGGGLPIGALGGPRRLMQRLAPEGDVYHGGTFAGHPLAMAAGLAALKQLQQRPPYGRLEAQGQRLERRLAELAAARGVPVRINRAGSMFTLFFSGQERFIAWWKGLRAAGILAPPSPSEALFLSTAHTDAHLDRFLRTAGQAFKAAGR